MRAAFLALVLLAACGKGDPSAPPPPEDRPVAGQPAAVQLPPAPVAAAPANPAAEARALFGSRCVTCHGTSGRGDGIASPTMKPAPRDYTDPAWQAGVTDEYLATIIVQGGAALGKSAMMPAQRDLADKPEVVVELVKLIRSFGAK